MSEVTRILSALEQGDPHAADELLPLVYAELRTLAAHRMAREPLDHTLQATALVHEAYLRLVGPGSGQSWNSRGHFFAAAAEAMRRILIDAARKKKSLRHGGGLQRVEPKQADGMTLPVSEELLDLDAALSKLEEFDPQGAEVVKFRFFAGLTTEEVAEALGISPRTAKREWAYARAWLRREMEGGPPSR